MSSPDRNTVSPDRSTASPDPNGPIVVHEGALNLKGRVMFCTRWKRKYVRVRADTRQLAIYDKKVSANSTGKRGECLIIQLKQVVECRPDITTKKRNSFLIQKTPNAGANRQIIFGCVNPADRDRWVHVINDVMNGTISGQSVFDEVVVSSSALTHIVKTRPKNPGRRPPGHRSRALISSPTSEISSFGDDADSGVGASSELLATQSTVHKSDGEACDDIIEQSPTSQESAERAASNECLVDVQVEDVPSPKSEKLSTLQRLKKQKKSSGEAKTSKQEKGSSFFGRLGSRISRALSRSQSTEESNEQTKNTHQEAPGPQKEEADVGKEFEGIKEEETKEEVRVSTARDTFYAMPPATKVGHDKVILELAAIAQNAKLVAAKAEALKSARLQGESDSSGEESTGGRTLSRRDSEKNIEQAAENLRTTLQNLSEAELLEIEKGDGENPEASKEEETKPDVAEKKKMNASLFNEMEGLFAKSNKTHPKRADNDEKPSDANTVESETTSGGDVNEKKDATNEIVAEIVNETKHDDGLEAMKKENSDEEKSDDEVEKEESKVDEQSEKVKESEKEKEKDEDDDEKMEDEVLNTSQVKESKEDEHVEDKDDNDKDDDDVVANEQLTSNDTQL